MRTRTEAMDRAKELALKHRSAVRLARQLEKEGLGGLLDRFELESIVTESEFIRELLPAPPGRTLPRTIGVIALLLGIAAVSLHGGLPAVRGYSPGGCGIGAIILGLILIIKPSSGSTEL